MPGPYKSDSVTLAMPSLTDTISNRLISNPRQLFLVDGIGALVSAFLLFVLLKGFSGMPSGILNQLSMVALFLSIYSLSCYAFLKSRWKNFMGLLSVLNGCYCILTLILMVVYFKLLSIAGTIYFIAEIAIIAKLATIEYKAFRQGKPQENHQS